MMTTTDASKIHAPRAMFGCSLGGEGETRRTMANAANCADAAVAVAQVFSESNKVPFPGPPLIRPTRAFASGTRATVRRKLARPA